MHFLISTELYNFEISISVCNQLFWSVEINREILIGIFSNKLSHVRSKEDIRRIWFLLQPKSRSSITKQNKPGQLTLQKISDPRLENYPFMGSPLPLLYVLIGYLWFVTRGGTQYMKHRKPFQLNKIMMIYNIFQVIANFVVGANVSYCIVLQFTL